MNFPTPPAFHDPGPSPNASVLVPQPGATARSMQQLPLSREQAGFSIQQQTQQQPQQQQHHQQQQQQQQQQSLLVMNGLNGAGNMAAPITGYPTPAGHQAELNYIYAMVDDLSRQLADNKRMLEDVVAGVGRVRLRARVQSLGNEELLTSAVDDMSEHNLDAINSVLSEALERAKYGRDANAALLAQYASATQTMLKQIHDYKARHVADVSAWHRSYRAQLAEARAENSRLREQIWDMQARAGAANELLRRFRAAVEDDREGTRRWERRVDAHAARQELRFWKRLAMPEVPDDDPFWSDDDDLVDPAEKERLRELEFKAAQEQLARLGAGSSSEQLAGGGGSGDEDDGGAAERQEIHQQMGELGQLAGLIGGVPMQRDDHGSSGGVPTPPPRPASASSTGSSGQ